MGSLVGVDDGEDAGDGFAEIVAIGRVGISNDLGLATSAREIYLRAYIFVSFEAAPPVTF